MLKKTKAIVTVATFISSTSLSLAAGSPYVGASIGTGGYSQYSGVAGNVNVFGGYGANIGATQKWYMGGELNARVGRLGKYSSTYYGLGASFMPGYNITQSTMIYTKLGLDTTYASHRTNYMEFTPQVGLGVQTELTKKIGLRGEYLEDVRHGGQVNLGLVYKFN